MEILAGKRRCCAYRWTMLAVRNLTALVAIIGRFDDLQPSRWVKQSTVERPQTRNRVSSGCRQHLPVVPAALADPQVAEMPRLTRCLHPPRLAVIGRRRMVS